MRGWGPRPAGRGVRLWSPRGRLDGAGALPGPERSRCRRAACEEVLRQDFRGGLPGGECGFRRPGAGLRQVLCSAAGCLVAPLHPSPHPRQLCAPRRCPPAFATPGQVPLPGLPAGAPQALTPLSLGDLSLPRPAPTASLGPPWVVDTVVPCEEATWPGRLWASLGSAGTPGPPRCGLEPLLRPAMPCLSAVSIFPPVAGGSPRCCPPHALREGGLSSRIAMLLVVAPPG